MMNLLLSPSGRINSAEFMKAAFILVALGLLLAVPEIMGMSKGLTSILGIISFLLIIPWIFIWIKRYHDGGKPGVMCLIPITVYIVLVTILMVVMMGDIISYAVQGVTDTGGAMDADMEAEIEAMAMAKILPMNIAGAILSLVVAFVFNKMIKHDPNDNEYGPAA